MDLSETKWRKWKKEKDKKKRDVISADETDTPFLVFLFGTQKSMTFCLSIFATLEFYFFRH